MDFEFGRCPRIPKILQTVGHLVNLMQETQVLQLVSEYILKLFRQTIRPRDVCPQSCCSNSGPPRHKI